MNTEQRTWNNLYNEGGEGYVPATTEEKEQYMKELATRPMRQMPAPVKTTINYAGMPDWKIRALKAIRGE